MTTKTQTTPRRHRARRPLTTVVTAALAAVALGLGAPAAYADTPCQDRTSHGAFAFAGDSNQYFAQPNGNFDTNAEWTHYGSRIVDGVNSPVNVARGATNRAGYLTGWSTMLSTWTCVRGNEDSVRFLVKPVGASPGILNLRLFVSDPTARTGWTIKEVPIDPSSPGTAYGNTGWYVTPRITIPWSPYWDNTQWVSFNFTSQSASGGWYVDDVMIDPWRTN